MSLISKSSLRISYYTNLHFFYCGQRTGNYGLPANIQIENNQYAFKTH